jgi:hypothetical protein
MRKAIYKYIIWMLVAVLTVTIYLLWPYTTESVSKEDIFTITQYRRHYPLDIEDAGMGKYLDEKICIDAADVCVRAERVFYSYPGMGQKAPWTKICNNETNQWRYFNRFSGMELKCKNCDLEALRCPKPPQTGTWFDDGNQSSELVGYDSLNLSTVRTFIYDSSGVTMKELPDFKGVVYGADSVISERFYDDRSKIAWIQCSKNHCDAFWLDFKTGTNSVESTPCHYGHHLTFELVGNRPELYIDGEAKGDEICFNTDGKPAYPFAPIPPPLPQFANPPVLEEAPKAAPEPSKPVIRDESVQPKPVKKQEEDEPEFGD